MLADPQVAALVDELRRPVAVPARSEERAIPTSRSFPTSTTTCARRFQRETEMLFESIMREDRSVLDLLDADYTFVNERLARHYGIPNVYGAGLPPRAGAGRRAPRAARAGQHAAGDLGANRTSPVIARQVDSREYARAARRRCRRRTCRRSRRSRARAAPASVRERMEQHRANPACAGCHKIMDPDRLRARELRRDRPLAERPTRA